MFVIFLTLGFAVASRRRGLLSEKISPGKFNENISM